MKSNPGFYMVIALVLVLWLVVIAIGAREWHRKRRAARLAMAKVVAEHDVPEVPIFLTQVGLGLGGDTTVPDPLIAAFQKRQREEYLLLQRNCPWRDDTDSCQGAPIRRCGYCGIHEGNTCGRAQADESNAMAYVYGTLNPARIPLVEVMLKRGIVANPVREITDMVFPPPQ